MAHEGVVAHRNYVAHIDDVVHGDVVTHGDLAAHRDVVAKEEGEMLWLNQCSGSSDPNLLVVSGSDQIVRIRIRP